MKFDQDAPEKPIVDTKKETTKVNLTMGIVVGLFIVIGTLLAWWYFRTQPPPETAMTSVSEHAGSEIQWPDCS